MSRTITFRAWHRQAKKMYQVTSLLLENGRITHIDVKVHEGGGEMFSSRCSAENVDLMQFTGLLDKAGREIYEGDIVLINHPSDRTGDFTNARGEVFWWEEEGAWYHGNGNGRPPKRMWEYVEVVGNIYETPE